MTSHPVLLAVALLAPALSGAAPDPAAPPTAQVRAATAGAPASGRSVAASVRAAERATLSTRLAASVRAVHVFEGARVSRGQLVVSLAAEDLRGGLAAAEAGLAAAAAHERRIRALAAEKAATPSELEQASAQRAQAQAAVAAARANHAYAALRAPISGTVQARHVEPGDLVGPGQPLLEIEGDALELQASLSSAEAEGLAIGAVLPFQAGAARGTAVVTALTPGGDPLSHRRTLRARVKTVEGELRSGAFARLEVPGGGGTPSGVFVPRTALVERGDLTGVFLAVDGRAELRWVSLGEPVGDQVPVRAGVRADEVVIDAPGALREGQPVEVIP